MISLTTLAATAASILWLDSPVAHLVTKAYGPQGVTIVKHELPDLLLPSVILFTLCALVGYWLSVKPGWNSVTRLLGVIRMSMPSSYAIKIVSRISPLPMGVDCGTGGAGRDVDRERLPLCRRCDSPGVCGVDIAGDTAYAAPASLVRTGFSWSLLGTLGDSASIRDRVGIVVTFTNPTRPNVRLQWRMNRHT